jgi:hypothetical protein
LLYHVVLADETAHIFGLGIGYHVRV